MTTTQVRVIRYVISLSDATKMMKKLNNRKHRSFNYFCVFEEHKNFGEAVKSLKNIKGVLELSPKNIFDNYKSDYTGQTGVISVYREIVT